MNKKSLFITKPKRKLRKTQSQKKKIKIYAKKLSSHSIDHRKKALFRLLELDSDYLAKFSILSGSFYINKKNIFLAAPEQIKTLTDHISNFNPNRFKIEKGEHSNFFQFDEIGMIRSEVGVMSLKAWKVILETQDYRNLPDPRTNIFWMKFGEVRDMHAIISNEEVFAKKSPIIKDEKKKKIVIKRGKNIRSNSLIVDDKQKKISNNGERKFRIMSNNKQIRPKSLPKVRTKRSEIPRRKKISFELDDTNKFSSILDFLDQRTDHKISDVNSDMQKIFTPKIKKRKTFDKEKSSNAKKDMRKTAEYVSFSPPQWKARQRKRFHSRGDFTLSVMRFKKKRERDEKRERAWSMERKFRKYENKERISVF